MTPITMAHRVYLEMLEGGDGICTACESIIDTLVVAPDATDAWCQFCRDYTVVGMETAMHTGLVNTLKGLSRAH